METLELEKEFTDQYQLKHTRIYGNSFAYLYEVGSLGGKIYFEVFDRLKTPEMKEFEKWTFKKDDEAFLKFAELTKKRR